jgi:hypothetical protein
VLAGSVAAAPARAQVDTTECAADAVLGQKLRRSGKLGEARSHFVSCARAVCREDIVRDCASWLAQLEDEIPSVVVGARDSKGADRHDVTIAVDGAPLASGDTGRAIALDPGRHVFVFEAPGQAPITREIVLGEGQKLREVMVVVGSPIATSEPPRRPIPVLAYVAGGVSVLGLLGFATLGAIGVSDRSSSGCDRGCDGSDATRVRTLFRVADVALIVSVLAGAAATALYLARPEERPAR